MLKVVVCGLALVVAGACSDDEGGDAVGALGLACYPNGTCNVGLECVRAVCVPEADEEVTSDVTSQETTTDTTTTPDTATAQEVTADTTQAETETVLPCTDNCGPYYAVIITDHVQFPNHRAGGGNPCATSSARAHGADIDAVGLFDGNDAIGYLDVVDYEEGGICTGSESNLATNPNFARGAPDATLTTGSVSLGGGWLSGEFDNALELVKGYTIVVYEAGAGVGGLDEGYEVYVADGVDCAARGEYPWADCAELVGEFMGEFEIPWSPF